jgi:probable addiction module antidote protein
MERRSRSYREVRMERLANPEVAAHYLNATMEHSPDQLLAALKNVAQARQMVKVAKDAGVQRETLYACGGWKSYAGDFDFGAECGGAAACVRCRRVLTSGPRERFANGC